MDKGQVGDVVDVKNCSAGRPGTVIEVGEVGPVIRWSDDSVSRPGSWPWKDLYLVGRPAPKGPAFQLDLWETKRVLERLRRGYASPGPIMIRMTEFVEKHEKKIRAKTLRTKIEQMQEELRKLEG